MIAGVGLRMTIEQAKAQFFDRDRIVDAVDKGKHTVFSRFGSYTRRDARNSMRPRKRPTSPGQPPAVHMGLVKQFLFFVYDQQADSVVVGPARIHKPDPDVLDLLEHGGTAKRRFRLMVRDRKGKLQPLPKKQKVKKTRRTRVIVRKKRSGERSVTISEQQVVSGKIVVRSSRNAPAQTVTYDPHPFMGPAFNKNLPKVPGMWRDIIK